MKKQKYTYNSYTKKPKNINKHLTFINECIKQANKSLLYNKHGCIITHKNRIISTGYNKINNSINIHAEIDALSKIKNNKQDLSLYVVRINKNNQSLMSKPCIDCYNAILKYNINKIYYIVDNNYLNNCYISNK